MATSLLALPACESTESLKQGEYSGSHLALWLACTSLSLLVCSLNILDGPTSSYNLFYTFPVILAAWWGRFPLGILVALQVVLMRFHVQSQVGNSPPPHFLDEIIGFSYFVLICGTVCRCRHSIDLERIRARTDSLTGAANGRVFYEVVNARIDRAGKHGETFTLAYLDIDDFKKINDRFGHLIGDQILKVVVETILKNTRRSADTIARVGGDEFALVLSETTAATAQSVLRKLRELLAQEMSKRGWPVTFSIGAMTFCEIPGDVEVLIQKVDSLMYRAKQKGKNDLCFEVFDATAQQERNASERRAAIRVACARPVRINTLADGVHNSWLAKTVDISATGLLFHCEKEFSKGAVLLVAPSGPLAGALVKVVRTIKDTNGWLHGCTMAQPLGMDHLQQWLEPGEQASGRGQVALRW